VIYERMIRSLLMLYKILPVICKSCGRKSKIPLLNPSGLPSSTLIPEGLSAK
jgi:hypothetical protein